MRPQGAAYRLAGVKQNWVREALRELDALLLPHSVERAELLAAGVSQARVASLYPFNIRDYRAGARRVFDDGPALVLSQGVPIAQVEWTLSRYLPRVISRSWEAEISSARSSARTRARSLDTSGGLLDRNQQLLTDMYLLPGLLHELARYPFEDMQWNDAARTKLEKQLTHLRFATEAMVIAAQSCA